MDGGGEGLGGAGVALVVEVHVVGGEEGVEMGPAAHELVAGEQVDVGFQRELGEGLVDAGVIGLVAEFIGALVIHQDDVGT